MAYVIPRPPHPFLNHPLTLTLSPFEGEREPAETPSPPQVVITGSVNSSELTLFDPVIHASRHGTRGWPGRGLSSGRRSRSGGPGHDAIILCLTPGPPDPPFEVSGMGPYM